MLSVGEIEKIEALIKGGCSGMYKIVDYVLTGFESSIHFPKRI